MPEAQKNTAFYDRSIAPAFGVAAGFFNALSREIEENNTQSSAASSVGRISAIRLEPENLTQKQKIAQILKKIDSGELIMAAGKTPTDIVAELSKSDYEGKSIKAMIAELKTNNEFLLGEPKLKPAAPKPTFARLLAPSFAVA